MQSRLFPGCQKERKLPEEAYRDKGKLRRRFCVGQVLTRFEALDQKLNLSALIVFGKFQVVPVFSCSCTAQRRTQSTPCVDKVIVQFPDTIRAISGPIVHVVLEFPF